MADGRRCYLFITFCWYIKLSVVIRRWRIIVVGTKLSQVLRLAHLLSCRFQRLELNRKVLQVSAAHYSFRQAYSLKLRGDVLEPKYREYSQHFHIVLWTSSRAPLKFWNDGFWKMFMKVRAHGCKRVCPQLRRWMNSNYNESEKCSDWV